MTRTRAHGEGVSTTLGKTGDHANSHRTAPPQTIELTPRAPRKRPSQGRSQNTVDVILEAATRIFDKHGMLATTNQIAELAGVSVGSLYQYFPDKFALVTELHERHRAHVGKLVLGVLDNAEGLLLDEVVLRVVAGSLLAHRNHPGLQRVLHAQLPQLSEDDETSPAKQVLGERTRQLLQAHMPAACPETLYLAAQTVTTMCESLVHHAILNPRVDLDDPALAHNISRALGGYLDRLAAAG
jgi:AcrR family transcriptional regulator